MEAPHLSELAENHRKDGLIVLGVNAWNEPREDVRSYAKSHDLKHRLLLDGENVYKKYGSPGLPSVLWIDAGGTVVDTELGFHSPDDLAARTKRLVGHGS